MVNQNTDDFSKNFPIGTKVLYYPMKTASGEFDLRFPPIETKIASSLFFIGDGTALVMIDGKRGGYKIDHIVKVEE